MPTTDHIRVDKAGRVTSFVGPSATAVSHAHVLASGIGLMLKGISPNRQWTRKRVLKQVYNLTGKSYGSGKAELEKAAADLREWAAEAVSKLPVVRTLR